MRPVFRFGFSLSLLLLLAMPAAEAKSSSPSVKLAYPVSTMHKHHSKRKRVLEEPAQVTVDSVVPSLDILGLFNASTVNTGDSSASLALSLPAEALPNVTTAEAPAAEAPAAEAPAAEAPAAETPAAEAPAAEAPAAEAPTAEAPVQTAAEAPVQVADTAAQAEAQAAETTTAAISQDGLLEEAATTTAAAAAAAAANDVSSSSDVKDPVVSNDINNEATAPPSAPTPEKILRASDMQCTVIRNVGSLSITNQQPTWVLSCYDIPKAVLDAVEFSEREDCQLVDGIRECSAVLPLAQ